MSLNYRWYNIPNQRVMVKMDVSPGLVYVVNFIEEGKSEYTCFFYPSVASQNQMAVTAPSKSIDELSIQERIFTTLRNILRDFADKYDPEKITFTTQFQVQLNKITSATIPGYNSEFTSGKQLVLRKAN